MKKEKNSVGMNVVTTFITLKAELVVNDQILQKAVANAPLVEQLEKDMALKSEFYSDEQGIICSVEKNFPIVPTMTVSDAESMLKEITEIFVENISSMPLPRSSEEDLEGCVLCIMMLDEAESMEIRNLLKQLKDESQA